MSYEKGVLDNRVRERANWGPFRGTKLFKIPDHALDDLINKSNSSRMSNFAFDEWRDREKLGLLGDKP
jgi:hypothetical protein